MVGCCVAGVFALDKLVPEAEYEETPTSANQQNVQSVWEWFNSNIYLLPLTECNYDLLPMESILCANTFLF